MKLIVYAIAKNEITFVDSWVKSMSESDEIWVLDTGSTDGTAERLEELGVHVTRDTIIPWRFDAARNRSLSILPEDADLCVSVDLDERFEPGWRDKMESAWQSTPGCNRLQYRFVFNVIRDAGGERDGSVFFKSNAHARHGFRWVCPCHEALVADIPVTETNADGVTLRHYHAQKTRRDGYLDLLRLGVEEDPKDARMLFYLTREYSYRGDHKNVIEWGKRQVEVSGQFGWHEEKGAAMLYMAQAFKALGQTDNAELYGCRAVAEMNGREPSMFLARLYYEQGRWWEGLHYVHIALKRENDGCYLRDPECYGASPHDLACNFYWQLGNREAAKYHAVKCLEFEPWNQRFRDNASCFGIQAGQTGQIGENDSDSSETPEPAAAETAQEDDPPPDGDGIVLAMACTRSWNDKLAVSLYSVLRFNRIKTLYLFVQDERIEEIERLAEEFDIDRVVYKNVDRLCAKYLGDNSPNLKPRCSIATLGRCFLAKETTESRVLYLDTDTVTTGPLRELWNLDMTGYAVAGCVDQKAIEYWGGYLKSLRYGGMDRYVNAGVLLMNLDLVRELQLDDDWLGRLRNCYYIFADQDVVNIAACDRMKIIGNEFNSSFSCGYSDRPKIVHYASIKEFDDENPIYPVCGYWQTVKREYGNWLAFNFE